MHTCLAWTPLQRVAGNGFLCVSGKGNPPFKVVIDKAAAESRPDDVKQLLDYAKDQSLMLQCIIQEK